MANLEAFKQKMGGGVRPNQFVVRVTPRAADLQGLLTRSGAELLGFAATIPASRVGQAPTFHRGRMIPVAGEREFTPWTVTYYADQKMNLRTAFEIWSNRINNYSDNTGETDPILYKGKAEVFLMDRNDIRTDDALKRYEIRGIFPIDVSEIQLAWEANDQVMQFSVTFAVEDVVPAVVS